jgi:hypothetical protein
MAVIEDETVQTCVCASQNPSGLQMGLMLGRESNHGGGVDQDKKRSEAALGGQDP